MSDRRPLRYGPEEPMGDFTCLYGLPPEPKCRERATRHVLWTSGPHEDATTRACADHYRFLTERSVDDYAAHDFDGVCDIPGALFWIPPTGEGYCHFDLEAEDEHAVTSEPVLVGALALSDGDPTHTKDTP